MSFTIPVTWPANSVSSAVPSFLAAVQTGTNTLTCYNEDDLFSASIPAVLGANLLEGPLVLDARFVGIHAQASVAGMYPGGWNRSHDMAPKWAEMNPADGVFVDAGMGAWLDACKAAGQQTVVTIFQTPTWLSARPAEGPDGYGYPGGKAEPSNMAKLGAFITWLVATYGDRIDFIEVGNEPKYSYALAGSYFSGTPANLAEMAKTIYQAAKAVKPGIKILGVGATGVLFNGAGSGITYTDQFLSASDGAGGFGRDWIDIVSVHTYAHDGANDITQMASTKAWIDGIKSSNGISAKPVWSTEFSYITPDFSTYTGPEASRAAALFRYCLWNIVGGFARINNYPLGWNSTPERAQLWNNIARILNGGTVTRINRLASTRQLACVINGQRYLV